MPKRVESKDYCDVAALLAHGVVMSQILGAVRSLCGEAFKVFLALLFLSCRDEKRPAPPPPEPRHISIDAMTRSIDAAPIDAAEVPDASDLTATLDEQAAVLRWGYASTSTNGVMVKLFDQPRSCADEKMFDDKVSGFRVRFEVPPGPDAKFYANQRIGVMVIVESSDHIRKIHPALSPQNVPMIIGESLASAQVELFKPKQGEHVRGTIEGDEHTLVGHAAVKGRFDVELCTPPAARGLKAVATSGAVHGFFGNKRIPPARTVHAIVSGHPASFDEAVEVSIRRRKMGSIESLSRLVFYDKPNVPCPADHEQEQANRSLFEMFPLSGTSATRPLLHTPQPSTGTTRKGKGDDHDFWIGWVNLENVAYKSGEHVKGSLMAQPAFAWDPKGEYSGHFDAIVCGP